MKKILLLGFLSFNMIVFGQDKSSSSFIVPLDDLIGTFQIQTINTRNQPLIPEKLNEIILRNRLADKVNYVMLASDVRLMILPLSEIRRQDFKPIEQYSRINN